MTSRPARSPTDRPRCLVEAGWGIGDVIEAAPTCHALWLLGFDVDFFVNRENAALVAPLFEGNPVFGRVFTSRREFDPKAYDVGIGCFGPHQAVRRLPAGFWLSTSIRDVTREGLAPANLLPARRLGHEGPSPSHPIRVEDVVAPAGCVVVHAGSDPNARFKRWPHWEQVCDRLARRGLPVVVVGTKDDRSASGWERRHDYREDLPLPRLAGLLRSARAYLGTDSGVSHLAGAVGTPGLILFGPTDPRCYAPTSDVLRVLDTPPRPGEGRHPIHPTFPAIDRIDVDAVNASIDRVLEDARRAAPHPAPPRRDAVRGDAAARLPSAAEIREAPATLDGMDELLRRTSVTAILGWLARREDPAEVARWEREVARAAGRAHLRAAAVRRTLRTWIAHRRERLHLRQAFRAGFVVQAGWRRVVHGLTPASRLGPENDPLRH